MRSTLESLSANLGLGEHVVFHGFVSQKQCAKFLMDCDALVLPSLYECGGAVVLEAMAMGRPVIATDWGGPHDYLDDTCGVLLAPNGRSELIEGFASAMQRLIDAPNEAKALGAAGRKRVIE